MATGQSAGISATSLGSTIQALKSGVFEKIDTELAALYATATPVVGRSLVAGNSGLAASLSGVSSYANSVRTGADGTRYVVVDATAKDGNGAALLGELNKLGFAQGSSYGAVASGLLPIDQIGKLSGIAGLAMAHQSAMGSSAGLVTSQADVALHSDTARTTYGVDGTGLKIGVLSDSFNTSGSLGIDGKPDTVATDIASGDLPAATKILQDLPNGTDEGRGMAQLIHDIAPGAAIDFATAFTGQAGFANNILALAADGSKVIVDDVIYYAEPAYQDGIIAQAVDKVAAQGVSYFSSAGNNGTEGYESTWYDGGYDQRFQGKMLEFAPGQTALSFVASGYDDVFILQWSEAAASATPGGAGSRSDLDFFVTDQTGNTVYNFSTDKNIGADPLEGFDFQGTAGQTYYLRVSQYAGPTPDYVKIMALGNGSGVDLGTTVRNINDGTTYGHAAATGANAVGAAYYLETPAYGTNPALPEPYTSGGPVRIAIDANGQRLDTPMVRDTPAFTAVDGTNTTFFGFDTRGDADKYPNFFGTSAAAPNAAAVSLLMLQANSQLTNNDVTNLLKSSSLDMAAKGYDSLTGNGLIQANLAVGFAKTLTIANADQPQLLGTHLNDVIRGSDLDNFVNGGAGNDNIVAGGGNDTVIAGTGDDIMSGGGGNDVLTGGAGTDSLFGGKGADRFVFGVGDGDRTTKDVVTDFESGIDKLDLTAIHDANGRYAITSSSSSTAVVAIDNTGDGVFDYNVTIKLTNGALKSGDILFA